MIATNYCVKRFLRSHVYSIGFISCKFLSFIQLTTNLCEYSPDNGRINGCGQIEESPKAAEDKFDEKPWNNVKLLADVHLYKC